MGFRLLRNTAALSVVLVLAGCAPHEPEIMPVPEPSATPIFASDEDALAAATDAYAKYLNAVDKSLKSFDVEMLKDSAEGEALSAALARAKTYKEVGNHQVGNSALISTAPTDMESVLSSAEDDAPIQIYACVDFSSVDVRDSQGVSIVALDRPDRVYELVSLVWHTGEMKFKIASEEVWENEC